MCNVFGTCFNSLDNEAVIFLWYLNLLNDETGLEVRVEAAAFFPFFPSLTILFSYLLIDNFLVNRCYGNFVI